MLLDYKALSEPITDEMVQKYAPEETKWLGKTTIITAFVVLTGFIGTPILLGDAFGRGVDGGTIAKLMLAATIAVGVVTAAVYGGKLGAKKVARLKRFAEDNDATYTKGVKDPNLAGMIFSQGHSRRLDESLAFANGIEIGNYTYVTGSGKNQSTHNYAFIRVALKRNLPHMVLDAKSNNFLGSNLPSAFNNDQKLSLEGDFNNYFTVFAPKDYERDALYVFTPDVMQVLVDKGAKHDMEIVGSELFIFKGGTFAIDSKAELESLTDLAAVISDELRDQSKRYTDERTSKSYVPTTADGKMPEVALQGQRLQERRPVMAVIFLTTLIAAVFVPPMLPTHAADMYVVVMWPAVFLMAIYFAAMKFMRRQ